MERLKQAADFYRHYSNLRFAILTVFTALSAALVNVYFGKDAHLGDLGETLLRVSGLVIAVFFGVYQWRLAYLIAHYQGLVRKLDEELTRKVGGELAGPVSGPRRILRKEIRPNWLYLIPLLVILPLHGGAIIFWSFAKR